MFGCTVDEVIGKGVVVEVVVEIAAAAAIAC